MQQLSNTLKTLLQEQGLTASSLARITGIGQPVIHRMLSGTTDNPKVATLSPIAKYFKISISQLIGDSPLQTSSNHQNNELKTPLRHLPLLTWQQALDHANIKTEEIQNYITVDANCSIHSFALRLQQNSGINSIPLGSLLLFDPQLPAQNQDYVLAAQATANAVSLQQVIIDGDKSYLITPNQNAALNDVNSLQNFVIIGVLFTSIVQHKKL